MTVANANSRVLHLAHRLETDIRRRSLQAGDPYLTAAAAGSMLGVSRMTANRAMNVLAERRVLVRQRSRGTFVGPAVESDARQPACCVHYITFTDDNPTLQLSVGNMLSGLRASLPDACLKSHFVPLQDAVRHVRREVESAARDDWFSGFILALGTRAVQRHLADSGLPTVVFGSVYPGIELPYVECDQKQIGRLLARHAIRAGYRRLVFVNRETWRRGDDLALDGIFGEVQAAGLDQDAFSMRNIPVDPGALAAEIDHLLAEVPKRTALLCRDMHFARAAGSVAASRGLSVPDELAIVYDGTNFEIHDGANSEGLPALPYPYVGCPVDTQKKYAVIARMLAEMAARKTPDPDHVVMPVALVDPKEHRARPTQRNGQQEAGIVTQ